MLSIRQKDANLLDDIRLQKIGGWFLFSYYFVGTEQYFVPTK